MSSEIDKGVGSAEQQPKLNRAARRGRLEVGSNRLRGGLGSRLARGGQWKPDERVLFRKIYR